MATPANVIALINSGITDNGNNEVTAAVLRPILIAMVDQINDLVGDPDNLTTTAQVIVDAINEVKQQISTVITIFAGTDNPNTTPPAGATLGDFYSRTLTGVPISYWTYEGTVWIELVDKRIAQSRQNIRISAIATAFTDTDDTVLYNGIIDNLIGIPTPAAIYLGRIITIVNQSLSNIQTNIAYLSINQGASSLDVAPESKIKLQCDGTNWYQL
jgi:hypothetical protein